jgi:hypothetical protein
LARYLPLHDELLGAPDLERGVIDFARESFARIVRSGVLALEPEAQPMGETDEGDVTLERGFGGWNRGESGGERLVAVLALLNGPAANPC